MLQSGIKKIDGYIYKGKYRIEEAIVDSARAAYLATSIEKSSTRIEKYDGNLNTILAKIKNENNPIQNKEEDSRLQSFRPKWRH